MPFNEVRVSWPHRGHHYYPTDCQTTVKYYGSIFGEPNRLPRTLTAVASQIWRPTRLATLAEANPRRVSLATLANPAARPPVFATGIARYARESLRSPSHCPPLPPPPLLSAPLPPPACPRWVGGGAGVPPAPAARRPRPASRPPPVRPLLRFAPTCCGRGVRGRGGVVGRRVRPVAGVLGGRWLPPRPARLRRSPLRRPC